MAALLAGCSSSSSDTDCSAFATCSTGGGVGNSGLATIDNTNALELLREAWYAATSVADTAAFVSATGVGNLTGVAVVTATPETFNCPTTGTFTVSGAIADTATVTAGDNLVYEASACDNGTGITINGVVDIDITSIDGDVASGMYEHGQSLTFTDFMASIPTNDFTLVGDHSSVVDSRDPDEISQVFAGNSLSIVDQSGGVTVSNFVGSLVVDNASPFATRISVAGRVASTLTQTVDFDTQEEMFFPDGSTPDDGIFRVTGNDSQARIGISDAVNVVIQVDANNNANYEISLVTTWDEFLNGTPVLNWIETGLD